MLKRKVPESEYIRIMKFQNWIVCVSESTNFAKCSQGFNPCKSFNFRLPVTKVTRGCPFSQHFFILTYSNLNSGWHYLIWAVSHHTDTYQSKLFPTLSNLISSDTVQFWHFPNLSSSNTSDTLWFWLFPILTLSYSDTFWFWHFLIVALSNSDTFWFWHILTVTLSDSDTFPCCINSNSDTF